MDSEVLDQILAGSDEAPASTPTAAATNAGVEVETQEVAKPASKPVAADPDMQWDEPEAEDDAGAPPVGQEDDEPTKAPDQIEDTELAEIEDRHKWMKGRLAPVKQKLSAAEQEIARLKAELATRGGDPTASTPTQAPQAAQPASLDEFVEQHPDVVALSSALKALEADAENMTMGEYTDKRLDILADLKLAKREIKQAVIAHGQAEAQAAQQAEAKVGQDYSAAVMAKKDELPGLELAFKRLDKNSGLLDVEIRRALVFGDDNKINPLAAELVHVIGNDKQALSYLISQSKVAARSNRIPTAAIEYIGRLKARIASEQTTHEEAPDVEETIAAAPRRKPGVPREIRHASNDAVSGDLGAWARDAVKAGKRPW